MLEISNLKIALARLDGTPESERRAVRTAVLRCLHVAPDDVTGVELRRRSVDARKRDNVHLTVTSRVTLRGGANAERALLAKLARRKNDRGIQQVEDNAPLLPPRVAKSPGHRPVVVGAGCAGLFCALALASAGLDPILVERGDDASRRGEAVRRFNETGELDCESNIQFGAGGAGTFSDGKLTTGTKSVLHRLVLDTFVEAGAAPEIAWDAKPHIGSDVLPGVVDHICARIRELGGEIRFRTRLVGIDMAGGTTSPRVQAVSLERREPSGLLVEERLRTDALVLACGHSARDVFELLRDLGVALDRKTFAMGVRIEHLQADIDRAQYGPSAGHPALGAAPYKLVAHLPSGRSAYSFCMCPGGYVVAAASEEGGVVTNGMSLSARDGENANSALLVTLHPEDFPDRSVLGGMYWQRSIEQKAFAMSGSYLAPAQLVGDFLARRKSTGSGSVTPSYRPGVHWCELHELFPEKLTDVLENAIPALGKRLSGFDDPDAVLTAPETRSSSPVRILRREDRSSEIFGLYPCGEGAGYAGGITSAAVDGIRCAESVMASLSQE